MVKCDYCTSEAVECFVSSVSPLGYAVGFHCESEECVREAMDNSSNVSGCWPATPEGVAAAKQHANDLSAEGYKRY